MKVIKFRLESPQKKGKQREPGEAGGGTSEGSITFHSVTFYHYKDTYMCIIYTVLE